MATIIEATPATFASEAIAASATTPVITYYYSPTCSFCQQLSPIIDTLAPQYEGRIVKVNVSAYPELAQQQSVQSIPDVRVVRNGAQTDSFVGLLPPLEIRGFLARNSIAPVGGPQYFDLTFGADNVALPTATLNTSPSGVRALDGDDTVAGSSDPDLVFGNRGNDLLTGGPSNDILWGGVDNDVINGDEGNDNLNGNLGNDTVSGGIGNDIVRGGRDNDRLIGDAGNDVLIGDFGVDDLFGGASADAFVLRAETESGQTDPTRADTIFDFSASDGDRVLVLADFSINELVTTERDISGNGIGDTLITRSVTGEVLGVVLDQSPTVVAPALTVLPSSTSFS